MFIFDLRQSVCCLFSPPGRCPQYNQPPMWSTALPLPVTSLSPLLSLTHQALPSASSPFTATLKMRMIQSFLLPGEPRFQSGHLMLLSFPQLLVVSNKNVIFKTFYSSSFLLQLWNKSENQCDQLCDCARLPWLRLLYQQPPEPQNLLSAYKVSSSHHALS